MQVRHGEWHRMKMWSHSPFYPLMIGFQLAPDVNVYTKECDLIKCFLNVPPGGE
jgi:hypothetical protein